jgi:hypothetical protein
MKNSIYKVTLFISCVLLLPLKSQESEKTNLFGKWFEFKNRPIIKSKIINNDIISAMIKVESAGNDSAYNLKEEAVGCLQIRPIMVREVNRILKRRGEDKRFKLKDRWSRDKSIEMFTIWRDYHHSNSEYEKIARNWNGGADGYKKKSTEKYWEKVSYCLETK